MNIVVGWTSRPESRAALERAVQEAKLRGATLHVVRTTGEGPSESMTQEWASETADVRDQGDALVRTLAEQGVEATFELDAVHSDPAVALLEAAQDVEAEMIVIGVRRRSPVGKLILGSVSRDVILKADCPVLAVKATEE